jgi:hypothetical protein
MLGLGATICDRAWVRYGAVIGLWIDHRLLLRNPARAGNDPCGKLTAYQRR